MLTHRLSLLEKVGAIKAARHLRTTCYFDTNVSENECWIIGHLRNSLTSKILLILLEREACSFEEITRRTKRSPATISERLKKLRNDGLVNLKRHEGRTYGLKDSLTIENVLSKYGFASGILSHASIVSS